MTLQKTILLLILSFISFSLSASDDQIKYRMWFHLRSDNQKIENRFLYRISAMVFQNDAHIDISNDFEMKFKDVQIRINDSLYYYSDLSYAFEGHYLGRVRKEPYILLEGDQDLHIQVMGDNIPNFTGQTQVPPIMKEVALTPPFQVEENNTIDKYHLAWDKMDCDKFEYWCFYADHRGDPAGNGNSVIENEIEIDTAVGDKVFPIIGFKINTENELTITEGDWLLELSITGPAGWKTSHKDLDFF